MSLRLASITDLPSLREVMRLATDTLQHDFLTSAEIEASHAIMGLDRQLVEDGTYFVAERCGAIAGCGGWSRRATLYGGDHSSNLREPRLLDPAHEAARVRAMYTHPDHSRRGVGRRILDASEAAAIHEGFNSAELMATLAGEPLYRAAGYRVIERTTAVVGAVRVPLVRMRKLLTRT